MVKFEKDFERTLVTSALPYVNNIPHLGTLICVLSADVYARFLRLRGEKVIFVLGTDENGTTSETKAAELGITPRECVDRFFKLHKEVYDWFEIKPDCFGRTSSKTNHEISQDIFLKLHRNGFIKEQEIEQLYSEKEDRFLADRFVEGTCPFCGYEKARGDQCDNCGRLLNATDLINPISKISGDKPIIKKTKHLFIDLPKLEPELKEWIHGVEDTWTENAKTTTDAWLKEGLKPRAITRDIKWGIPVPLKSYENKVFYSWFDAPIGYISITKDCSNDWQTWWKDKKTRLVQFMGKDNIPFHTILFPAFILGANDGYILADTLSVNEYLNYEDGKFSKSLGVGVFCDDAKSTGIPADVWRYYLMIKRPETNDSQFSWDGFVEKTNNELVANLGNLVNRTLFFVNKYYDSTVPKVVFHFDYSDDLKEITRLLEEVKLRDALKALMHLSKKGNAYFQEEEPWKNIKENKDKADNAVAVLVNLIKDLSILVEPFLPETALNIRSQLNIDSNQSWSDLGKFSVVEGHRINKSKILFNKLEEKQIDDFKKRFAGKQIDEKATKSEVVDISILDLKVAKILSAEDHPKADKLYILKTDMGTEQRQIVAGLKQYYEKQELQGKNIVLVANLEPAKLRGIESQGMLLAAEDENKTVGVLTAPDSKTGEPVFTEKPSQNTKKVPYSEFAKLEIVAKQGSVYFNNKKLKTQTEDIKIDKVTDGNIS